MTPLFLAIAHLDVTMVEALLDAGADAQSCPPGWNMRPIDWAVNRGSVAVVHTLVSRGVPLKENEALAPEFRQQSHPFVLAAEMDRAPLFEALAVGMSQSELASYGTMAMHVGAARGHLASMRAIRLLRIPYNAQASTGTVPMHQAARFGREEALSFLLRRGEKWDFANKRGETAADVLRTHHPELAARFGLSLPENVRPLFGRRPRP